MKTKILLLLLAIGLPLSAQTNMTQIAPGADAQLARLLNKPSMVKPAAAASLGKNWFTLEVDTHVLTDEVSFNQAVAVLLDLENQDKIFNGKKSRVTASVVSRGVDEMVFDMVNISVAPLGIQIKTPYRASIKTIESTDTRFVSEIRQLSGDSDSNKNIKNLYATRLVENVTINGKKYVYIRIYSIDDVNASILPGAKNTLENNADPASEEALQLIIDSAKTRRL